MLFKMTFLTTFISIIKLYDQIWQNYFIKLLWISDFLMKIGSHFEMQIRRSKTQNFAWKPWFSDSAPLNCVEWQNFLPNASNLLTEGHFSQILFSNNTWIEYWRLLNSIDSTSQLFFMDRSVPKSVKVISTGWFGIVKITAVKSVPFMQSLPYPLIYCTRRPKPQWHSEIKLLEECLRKLWFQFLSRYLRGTFKK